MIGLGTWEGSVNMMFFKGVGRVTIKDVDGKYDFKLEIIGEDVPEFTVSEVTEDGNTLHAVAQSDAYKGKKIPVTAVFDGDSVIGTVKLPIFGQIKIKGHRVNGD